MTATALQPQTCACTTTEVRIRQRANGARAYVLQCVTCGRELRAVKKDGPEVRMLADYPAPFDEALRESWLDQWRGAWERQREAREEEQAREDAEWRERYNAYLKTPRWYAKRALVFDRAGGMCEGCRRLKATQVHHLHYKHMGDELLFELVAVCDACHRTLHPNMDDR